MKNLPNYHLKHNKKSNTLILSASDIEQQSSAFLQEYSNSKSSYSLLIPQATPIEDIIDNYCEIIIDYKTFDDSNILGITTFSSGFIKIIRDGKSINQKIEKGTILISNELAEDEKQEGRCLYTLAHEFGHIFYHRVLFEIPDNSNQLSLFDEESVDALVISCHRDNIENLGDSYNKNWTEWQADYFASCILMPREAVYEFWKPYVRKTDFILEGNPKSLLSHLDWLETEYHLCEFTKLFKVSYQAAKIRLKKLNYI